MKYTYKILKTSWGIVVGLDMEEVLTISPLPTDIKITDQIYLRIGDINKEETHARREKIEKWISLAIKHAAGVITSHLTTTVCFYVKHVDMHILHSQEEGLYCAARGWLIKYYGLGIEQVPVRYDKAANKYTFDIPTTE